MQKEAPQARSNLIVPLCLGLVAPSLPAMQAFADELAPVEVRFAPLLS